MSKKAKIDFSSVTTDDLDGNKVPLPYGFLRNLGNRIYVSASSIEVADLGRKIHSGHKSDSIELNYEELNTLIQIFDSVKLLGYPVHLKVKEYLNDMLQTLKPTVDESN